VHDRNGIPTVARDNKAVVKSPATRYLVQVPSLALAVSSTMPEDASVFKEDHSAALNEVAPSSAASKPRLAV
jgi:hypothetical protein